MNTEDILLWIIANLLTEEQLDTKLPTGETIRHWHTRRLRQRS
jgi:hypothetical protein